MTFYYYSVLADPGVLNALHVAVTAATCRAILEAFAVDFKKEHGRKDFLCSYTFNGTTTDILDHFENCDGLSADDSCYKHELLGEKMSINLEKRNYSLPKAGSLQICVIAFMLKVGS
jgi:hypothetical protein